MRAPRPLVGPSLTVALMALALSASSVAAASWGPQVALTSTARALMWAGGLATTASGTALVAYNEAKEAPYQIFIRRSVDGGSTWKKSQPISNSCSAGGPTISANGEAIDAVWVETKSCLHQNARRIAYRRSLDGGRTWGEIKTIAATSPHSFPNVARASDGTVIVAWTDDDASTVYARTSTDGGTTFGSRIQVGKTTNEAYEELPGVHDGFVRVAIGSGVIYLGFQRDQHTLVMRRSTDHGKTWGAASVVSDHTDGYSWWTVTAEGTHAVVAFARFGSTEWTQYRRTTDSGASWSDPVDLSPRTGASSSYPIVTLRDGQLFAEYRRQASNGWYAVYFRHGPESGPLSAPIKLAGSNHGDAYPGGIDLVGTTMIATYDLPDGDFYDVYSRAK